ncbi:hypothetical protein PM082_024335 [Marasmius tenuissimus]|nr:hypothetical protein PM082_024335 [Marasmius tenuissimus]
MRIKVLTPGFKPFTSKHHYLKSVLVSYLPTINLIRSIEAIIASMKSIKLGFNGMHCHSVRNGVKASLSSVFLALKSPRNPGISQSVDSALEFDLQSSLKGINGPDVCIGSLLPYSVESERERRVRSSGQPFISPSDLLPRRSHLPFMVRVPVFWLVTSYMVQRAQSVRRPRMKGRMRRTLFMSGGVIPHMVV